MTNLNTIEIKTFLPAKNYQTSKAFYTDLGFSMGSDENGIAYFHAGNCSFLLQDFYEKEFAQNLMMHLLVEDIQSWHQQILANNISEKYNITVGDITEQPWGMLDFIVSDPSGVLWRLGQNVA